ncbi:MAG: hypothetical protein OEZ04_04485 [Nitrospinota bacterium]|nr:hypothetical protein [Nitrospinota bacterium]
MEKSVVKKKPHSANDASVNDASVNDADKNSDTPFVFPKGSIPKTEQGLQRARNSHPVMIREIYVQAPQSVVSFFLQRPHMAYKATRYVISKTSMRLRQDEESGEWDMKSEGASYTLIPLGKSAPPGLVGFRVQVSAPLIGKKLTGHGLLMIHAGPGEEKEETEIGYDLRVAADPRFGEWGEGVAAYLQSVLTKDAESLVYALQYLCEETDFDAETLAEDMELEEDLFTKEQMNEFREMFVTGAKKR